jgi:hypothetical protein
MSELGDAIERLEFWARGEEFDELTVVIAAARERDAMAAVIEEARAHNAQFEVDHASHHGDGCPPPGEKSWTTREARDLDAILSRTPSDVLVERDARIRAEVIDWIAGRIRSIPHWWDVSRAVDDAREHFGLTKGADRG